MARPGGGAQVRGSHAGAARPPSRPPLPPPPRNTSGNTDSYTTSKTVEFLEKNIVQFRYFHPSLATTPLVRPRAAAATTARISWTGRTRATTTPWAPAPAPGAASTGVRLC